MRISSDQFDSVCNGESKNDMYYRSVNDNKQSTGVFFRCLYPMFCYLCTPMLPKRYDLVIN